MSAAFFTMSRSIRSQSFSRRLLPTSAARSDGNRTGACIIGRLAGPVACGRARITHRQRTVSFMRVHKTGGGSVSLSPVLVNAVCSSRSRTRVRWLWGAEELLIGVLPRGSSSRGPCSRARGEQGRRGMTLVIKYHRLPFPGRGSRPDWVRWRAGIWNFSSMEGTPARAGLLGKGGILSSGYGAHRVMTRLSGFSRHFGDNTRPNPGSPPSPGINYKYFCEFP
jgi:hypothetical protein